MEALARAHQVERWGSNLEAALANPEDSVNGLTYGLEGSMDKVGNGMYLLTPANVSVSPEDRRRMSDPNHET